MMEIAKTAFENRYKQHMRLDKRMTDLLMSLDRSYNRYVNSDGTLVVVLDKVDKAFYGTLIGALERIGFLKNALDRSMCT
jgi:hypothetical protein